MPPHSETPSEEDTMLAMAIGELETQSEPQSYLWIEDNLGLFTPRFSDETLKSLFGDGHRFLRKIFGWLTRGKANSDHNLLLHALESGVSRGLLNSSADAYTVTPDGQKFAEELYVRLAHEHFRDTNSEWTAAYICTTLKGGPATGMTAPELLPEVFPAAPEEACVNRLQLKFQEECRNLTPELLRRGLEQGRQNGWIKADGERWLLGDKGEEGLHYFDNFR